MTDNSIISVFGEPVEIVVSSKSTMNTLCVGIQTSPPGGGPPPHTHARQDEIFFVLEGEYEMFDGQQWTKLRKGECRYGMKGGVHAFRNSGLTPGRMLFVVTPGGLDEYFEEISTLSLPRDIARFDVINERYGYTFSAPEPGQSPAV